MTSRRASVLAAGVVVATVAAGLLASRAWPRDSGLESALRTLPRETLIANFTDWAGIRDEVDPGIGSDASIGRKAGFYDAVYERDLSVPSVLAAFDGDMAAAYGWTVLDAEWEMYGQSRAGAVDVLKMDDGFDFDGAAESLTRLGYSQADEAGVRAGGSDVVAAISPDLTPQLGNIALVPDEGVVVVSDSPSYAALAVDTIAGDRDPVLDAEGVDGMAAALGDDALAAILNVGRHSCAAAGFGQVGADTRRLVRQRIAAAGGVHRTQGLALALDRQGRLTVVLAFPDAADAEADLPVRRELATGEAPAQGGTFDDRFSVTQADVAYADLVLRLTPHEADAQLLSDLGRGGLLFAAC